jgi:predicted Zn-dependent protease
MANSNLTGPTYYKRGNVEVWDFIRDQELNYHLGNAIKYICRAGYKNSKAEDLRKAIHYLQNELDNLPDPSATSKRVQAPIQSSQLPVPYIPQYTADFDR